MAEFTEDEIIKGEQVYNAEFNQSVERFGVAGRRTSGYVYR